MVLRLQSLLTDSLLVHECVETRPLQACHSWIQQVRTVFLVLDYESWGGDH